jgi:signal transduction histidine kinase
VPDVVALVKDSKIKNLRSVQNVLTRQGYHILMCDSYSDSLKILESNTVDIFILDLNDPDLSLPEFAYEIQRAQAFTAILATSSQMNLEVTMKSIQSGIDGLLILPTNQDEQLVKAIQGAIVTNRQKVSNWIFASKKAHLNGEWQEYQTRMGEPKPDFLDAWRQAAIGRLISSISHEINNPIQSMSNCLYLASRPDLDEHQRMSYLELSRKELDRLILTLRTMLDFYRPIEVDKESVKIESVINKTLSLLEHQLNDHGVSVYRTIKEPQPDVCIVPNQIQQAFLNLLFNAIEAMEETVDRHIWIDALVDQSDMIISFEDSGIGISPEIQKQIFEPFFSTKSKGTGLGLVISSELIKAHGGNLRLSHPVRGHGACFEVILPITRKNA